MCVGGGAVPLVATPGSALSVVDLSGGNIIDFYPCRCSGEVCRSLPVYKVKK